MGGAAALAEVVDRREDDDGDRDVEGDGGFDVVCRDGRRRGFGVLRNRGGDEDA